MKCRRCQHDNEAGARFCEECAPPHRDALGLATELSMRPLVARCHLGLGTLHRRTGDRVKANKHLSAALTLYRQMEMLVWRKKVEAQLRESA